METSLWNELMVPREEGYGEAIVREFGMNMYTLLYLKWITNNLYSTGSSAKCYVAVWMGGKFEVEWIHVYVWLSPLLFT